MTLNIKKIILLLSLLFFSGVSSVYALNVAETTLYNNAALLSNTYGCGGAVLCDAKISFFSPVDMDLTQTSFAVTLDNLDGTTSNIPVYWKVLRDQLAQYCFNDSSYDNNTKLASTNQYCYNYTIQVESTSLVAGDNTIYLWTDKKPKNSVVDWNFQIKNLDLTKYGGSTTVTFDTRVKGWALWGNTSGKIDYWRQKDSTNTTVWVKLSNISTGQIIQVIITNNTGNTWAENGNSVFIFFDDFAGTTLNTSKWTKTGSYLTQNEYINYTVTGASWGNYLTTVNTFPQNISIDWMKRVTAASGGGAAYGLSYGLAEEATATNDYHIMDNWAWFQAGVYNWTFAKNGKYSATNAVQLANMNAAPFANQWVPFSLIINSTGAEAWVNGTKLGGDNSQVLTDQKLQLGDTLVGPQFLYDNVRVRKYIREQMPTVSCAGNVCNITGVGNMSDVQIALTTNLVGNLNISEQQIIGVNETLGRQSILQGIQSSIINNSYSVVYDRQVYIRIANGSQYLGRFDVYAQSGNKRWAFNYDQNNINSFPVFVNITPVFYVWQKASMNSSGIINDVSGFINVTN